MFSAYKKIFGFIFLLFGVGYSVIAPLTQLFKGL